jgi:hypothetical protein
MISEVYPLKKEANELTATAIGKTVKNKSTK